ncbi:formylglycine-generating enzyme family protein [Azospirillum isscasi]|uniref:Formylglycine-generating enzyme family protein n=1 Tax=Azospirillum isscasi TaxID=3053926 RepID=A0ABU0WRE4_9PROT|nr:formylglycine-generating enzyme family protein [Azospirillum isscasi]MDQ2106387.1 formylglycine-generating enzyme family protein [Azospirillum isscasi]
MEAYLSLAFLIAVLALPYLVYRRERQAGETFGDWFNRTGDPPFAGHHRALVESRWVRPRWLWRYGLDVARLGYVIVWIGVVFMLGIGSFLDAPHFDWRNPRVALAFIHIWTECLVVSIFFLFVVFMVRVGGKEAGFSWRRTAWYCGQMAVIGLAVLQIYGALVHRTQLRGLEPLIAWHPAPPPRNTVAEEDARRKAMWSWMDAYLEGSPEARERLWSRLPPGFSREELQGLIDRIARFQRERAKAARDHADRVIEPGMIAIPRTLGLVGCVEGPGGKPPCPESELPARMVEIAAFDIAAREVTFAEWDACYVDGGCDWVEDDQHPEEQARGRNPVANVSWDAAQRYIVWLNGKTGKRYHLPSESEWEIAARAGSAGRHTVEYLAEDQVRRCAPPSEDENCLHTVRTTPDYAACSRVKGDCPSGVDMDAARPVGSFPPNRWGLHDMTGNVAEWVQDCWTDTLLDAPQGGGAVDSAICTFRVVRGGSFSRSPGSARPSYRYRLGPAAQFGNVGFRLARSAE